MVGMAVLSSLVSGLLPLLVFRNGVKKSSLLLLLGLSAGILFAIATVDLIPEGIGVSSQFGLAKKLAKLDTKAELGHSDNHVDLHLEHEVSEFGRMVTMVGVGIGFFSLVLLEQFMLSAGASHSHQAPEEEADEEKHKSGSGLSESFSLTAFAAIAVHSLVDGIVIGGSFRVSATIGVRVAIAIVLHKVFFFFFFFFLFVCFKVVVLNSKFQVPDGFVVASLLTATNR